MQTNNITGLRPKGDVSNYITRYCGIEEECSPILSYFGKTERNTLVDLVEGKTDCKEISLSYIAVPKWVKQQN